MFDHLAATDVEDDRDLRLKRDDIRDILFRPNAEVDASGFHAPLQLGKHELQSRFIRETILGAERAADSENDALSCQNSLSAIRAGIVLCAVTARGADALSAAANPIASARDLRGNGARADPGSQRSFSMQWRLPGATHGTYSLLATRYSLLADSWLLC